MMPKQGGGSKCVVAVTGIESLWGPSLLRELLQAGELVVALLSQKLTAAAFAAEIRQGCLQVVWGRGDDPTRLYSLLAIHEVTHLFHLDRITDPMGSSLAWAVNRYCRALPVITLQTSTAAEEARQLLQSLSLRYGIVEVDELFGPEIGRTKSADAPVERRVSGRPLPGVTGVAGDRGDGTKRDYVYVGDAALALRLVAQEVIQRRQSLALPFRSGWRFTSAEWRALQEKTRAGEPCTLTPMTPGHPLGWYPQQSLAEALLASYGGDATSVSPHDPSVQRRAA
jgi:nucleoside-diphosphate-sugar epimerase